MDETNWLSSGMLADTEGELAVTVGVVVAVLGESGDCAKVTAANGST